MKSNAERNEEDEEQRSYLRRRQNPTHSPALHSSMEKRKKTE